MKNNKAVIFDLDGTLLDTLDDLTDSINFILAKYGFPLRKKAEIRHFLGDGAANLIRRSLPENVDEEETLKYIEEYKAYYEEHSQIKTVPYIGLPELLDKLRANGIRIGVVSNKPDKAVKALVEKYFPSQADFILGDRPGIERKPSAAPIRLAMSELGCERAIFVGDSDVDVRTAQNSNLPCVAVTWGFRDKDVLISCGATVFATNACELEKRIYDIFKGKL